MNIGIFGTFDVENYGDLLFPMLAQFELGKRLDAVNIQLFSYHEKTALDWIYPVHSLANLPALARNLDGVLIGGGHIIRFDKGVAPGYGPPSEDIHHPTGYWLAPMFAALQHNIPIVWNAPGVYGEAPDWIKPLLTTVMENSDYISVRDEWAKELLEAYVPHCSSRVVVTPDTAFSIASLFPRTSPSPTFLSLQKTIGLTKPYFVFQATFGLEGIAKLIRENPVFFDDYQIVAICTAPVCGDRLTYLEDILPHFIHLPEWPHPALMAELISGAKAVIGTSLHLSITALAYHRPVFRPIILCNKKYNVLFPFETIYQFSNEELTLEWFTSRLDLPSASPLVLKVLENLSSYWDHVASKFSKKESSPDRSPALIKLWQILPNLLESSAQKIVEKSNLIDEQENTIHQLLSSSSWKVTAPLRHLKNKIYKTGSISS